MMNICSKIAALSTLLLNHGWPGSIVEFLHIIDQLAHPEKHGGKEEDAFNNFYRAQIDQYFENPEDFNISKPRRLPDGSPIGSYSCFY